MPSSEPYFLIPAQYLPNPGTCRTCGSNQRDCVDFGITIDFEGAILICVSCIQQLKYIEELDLIDRKTVDNVIEANRKLMVQQAALDLLKKELRDGVVAVLDRYDLSVTDSISDLLPVPASGTKEPERLF